MGATASERSESAVRSAVGASGTAEPLRSLAMSPEPSPAIHLPAVCSIRTPRLLLRAYRTSDAPRMQSLININLDRLRPWMRWAREEPEPLEKKIERLRMLRRNTLAGRDQAFAIFTSDESQAMGGIGTHCRIGAGAREIGYWLGADFHRQGYMTEAAAALVRIGFEVQRLRRMEIHTDPTNIASAGVARTLGFHLQTIVRNCVLQPDSPVRDDSLWALLGDQHGSSRAAAMPIEAFDRRGERVL